MTTYASLKGRTVRMGGSRHEGWLPVGAATPRTPPVEEVLIDLEITDDGDGHYLLIYDSPDSNVSGDTWHETLDAAYEQAQETFGVARNEWLVHGSHCDVDN